MITLYFISLSVFLLYNAIVFCKFGIPASLSETFYLWKEKVRIPIFWGMTVGIALPLAIFGCHISPETFPSEFSMFFCAAFLIFVGTASAFKDDFVKKYHFTFAGICAALSLLWIASTFLFPAVYVVGAVTLCFIPLGFIWKGVTAELLEWKREMSQHENPLMRKPPNGREYNRISLTFWLEMICFVSLYICLWLYYTNS